MVVVEKEDPNATEWDKMLHKTFVPDALSLADDTLSPINLRNLREEVIEWLSKEHNYHSDTTDRDSYGHREMTAPDVHYLAAKILKEFEPTSTLCKKPSISKGSI